MYRAITEMSTSPSLLDRIAACLATRGAANPRDVATSNAWRFAATPGWGETWQGAVDAYNINQNPDTGARNDVITDAMIEEAVGAVYGPQERTGEDGNPTTRAADPTLPPEKGGPSFEVAARPEPDA